MLGLSSASVKLGGPLGPWIGLLLALGFAVIALLGVRQAWALALPRRRAALVGLRLATAFGAMLYAIQPEWVSERVQSVPGRLAVLLDVSRSMSVRDATQSRAARALSMLQASAGSAAPPFDLFAFGAEIRATQLSKLDPNHLAYEDDTRITHAIERVVSEAGEELGAVVVVSDGADRSPLGSLAQLKALGVRVHAIAVTSERPLIDDAIVAIKADPVAFLRETAQVEVSVRSTQRRNGPIVVTLRDQSQVVAEATADLDAQGQGKVVVPFTPLRLGRAVYTVSIPVAPTDSVVENNERSFLVRVTRDKLRVLLLCGAPTWDTRFLRAFLKSDPAIDLITFFILRTSNDLTLASPEELSLIPFPTDELFREHLGSFDVVIFQDFNYGPYQVAAYIPRIRDYVVRGGAFAMLGGSRSYGAGGYDRTALAEILPVRMAPGASTLIEGEFAPVLSETASRHPIVELVPDPAQNLKAWSELAPLVGVNRILGARENAQVLLSHPRERGDRGGPMPVLAVGNAGKGRVLSLAADSSWRWGITTAGARGDASAYDRFWDRALRWLTRDPLLEAAQVETDRERYGPGTELRIKVRARDARYAPIANRAVQLRILDAQGAVRTERSVQTDADGSASVAMRGPDEPSAYRVELRESAGAQPLAEQGFLVEAGGDELADPRPDAERLRAIASATGGEFHELANPPSLRALDRTRARTLGTEVAAPFRSVWFFGVLVALFALEWALRRAFGLR